MAQQLLRNLLPQRQHRLLSSLQAAVSVRTMVASSMIGRRTNSSKRQKGASKSPEAASKVWKKTAAPATTESDSNRKSSKSLRKNPKEKAVEEKLVAAFISEVTSKVLGGKKAKNSFEELMKQRERERLDSTYEKLYLPMKQRRQAVRLLGKKPVGIKLHAKSKITRGCRGAIGISPNPEGIGAGPKYLLRHRFRSSQKHGK